MPCVFINSLFIKLSLNKAPYLITTNLLKAVRWFLTYSVLRSLLLGEITHFS